MDQPIEKEMLLITQSIEIQMLPRNASNNIQEMERITNIVNDSFRTSEKGIWKNDTPRTTVLELTEFTSNGEIAVARLMGEIIGCVRVQEVDQETGGFGMLAVDNRYQGNGIASMLVGFAEQRFKRKQYSKMQLELLIPKEVTHPSKVFLENWYNRIGYQRIYTESFETSYPRLAKMLAIPCKFVVFQKTLG